MIVHSHDGMTQLTHREHEVLKLIAEGRSNQGISDRLFLSPRTVETHVRQIFLKLGLSGSPDTHRRVLAVIAFLRPGDTAGPWAVPTDADGAVRASSSMR